MLKKTRKLLGLLLAIAVFAGSIQFPGAGVVNARETVSVNDLISGNEMYSPTMQEGDNFVEEPEDVQIAPVSQREETDETLVQNTVTSDEGSEVTEPTVDTYGYVRDTDGIDAGGEYIITWNVPDTTTERVLFCNAETSNVLGLTPNGDNITPSGSFALGTQVWTVLDAGNGSFRLKSAYESDIPHYLDLTQEAASTDAKTPQFTNESEAPLVSITSATTEGKYLVKGVVVNGTNATSGVVYYLKNSGGGSGRWRTDTTNGSELTFWKKVVVSQVPAFSYDVTKLFDDSIGDNIWVFTGGQDVAVSFEKTANARNYIGHFEEYIRYTGSPSGDYDPGKNFRQRYTINMGKDDRDLEDIVTNWSSLVAANQPKAVSFFLGEEDYSKGEEGLNAFATQLKLFIDKALALKNNQGFAVIQLPYVTGIEEKDAAADLYSAKVREVIRSEANGFITDVDKYKRIVLVDHNTATSEMENWLQDCITDGKLNLKGHFEIGKQLCAATIKNTNNYPNGKRDQALTTKVILGPANYVEASPSVTVTETGLQVTLSEEIVGTYGTSYSYEVTLEDSIGTKTVVTNNVTVEAGKSFTIEGLEQGNYWQLQMRTVDGTVQLGTVEGQMTPDAVGSDHQPKAFTQRATNSQKKLANLLNSKDSVRWLFVGDSITHGCAFTRDYDNTVQLFEKYVKDTLNRKDDIIINTAVAGAKVADNNEENRVPIRLGWNADVVMIMLGTNDAAVSGHSTKEQFIANFNTLLNNIKENNPNAIIVFRLPVYSTSTNADPLKNRATNVIPIVQALKEIAQEDNGAGGKKADFVIDQYEMTTRETKELSWLFSVLFESDGVHPNEVGQLQMFRQLIKGLGLEDNDSPFMDLSYQKVTTGAENNNTVIMNYLTTDDTEKSITLDVSALVAQVTDLATVTLKITNRTTGQSWSVSEKRDVILNETDKTTSISWPAGTKLVVKEIPWSGSYKIEVNGWAISAAKEIRLSDSINLGEVDSYEVVFDSNGGSDIPTQNIEAWKKVAKPINPTKEGYRFMGWYLEDVFYDFSDDVTEPITLTAKWLNENEPSTLDNPEVYTKLKLGTQDDRYLIYDIIYQDTDNNPLKLTDTAYTRVLYDDGGNSTGWLKYDNTWEENYEPKYLWKMTATDSNAAYEMRSQKLYDKGWPIYAPYGNTGSYQGKEYLFALSRKIASGAYNKLAAHAKMEFWVMGKETLTLGGEEKEVVYVAITAEGDGARAGKRYYLSTEDGNMSASASTTSRRTYVHWLELTDGTEIPKENGWWVIELAPETPEGPGDVKGRTLLYRTSALEYHYRIPAIATANNGNLIAAIDYRFHSNADVGTNWNNWDGEAWRAYTYGHQIDLHTRTSKDNGKSWEAAINRTEGLSVAPDFTQQTYANGYGDPALVADRDSDEVLMVSVSGYKGYVTDGNEASYMLSKDNGETFENPVNISEQIYGRFNSNSEYYDENLLGQSLRKFFFASGKIHQSRYIKVGTHYRIYSSVLANYTTNCNYVLYSDDFGKNWYVLGNTTAIPSGGDEAKIEELPNGDVVITSRIHQGRKVNIFKYDTSDPTFKTGSWGVSADMNIAPGSNNGCNGEVYVVYAKDNTTGTYGYVILQSLPTSTGRTGVRIFYRWLDAGQELSVSDFADTSKWSAVEDSFLLQDGKSCYSTMILQADGKIGVVWEEGVHEYDIVYKALDLTEITNEKYSVAFPAGGIGSKDTPYLITNEEQAQAVESVYASECVYFERSTADDDYDDNGEGVLPEDIPEGGIPEGLWIAGVKDEYEYTGSAIKPQARVYDGERRLTSGTDYTISYKNNIKVNNPSNIAKSPSIVVKGKGNYSGTETKLFNIKAVDLTSELIDSEDLYAAYNDKVQKPVPVVTFNGQKLKVKRDFTVSYTELNEGKNGANKEAGEYEVVLTAVEGGNFTGKTTVKFTITNQTLMSKVKVAKIRNQSYSTWEGNPVEPKLTVTMSKKPELVENKDYTVEYVNNEGVGTATAILTGMGEYVGTKKVTFKITGVNIKSAKLSGLDNVAYNTEALELKPVVMMNEKILVEDEDYIVSYTAAVDAGKVTVTITGINNYTGTIKKTYSITPFDLSLDQSNTPEQRQVTGLEEEIVAKYSKGGAKPSLTLYHGDVELVEGKDYKLSYKNNSRILKAADKNAPMVTVKGIGNYKGTVKKNFTIEAKSLDDAEFPVTISVADVAYNKKAGKFISKPVVTDVDGKVLKAGKDYDTVYFNDQDVEMTNKDTPNVGSIITVQVKGKGMYTGGTLSATYEITELDFTKAKIKIKPQAYTGDSITLDMEDIESVIVKGVNITKDFETSYAIIEDSYSNNMKKGTAKVTFKGLGNYGGNKTVTFKITTKNFVWFWNLFQ